MKVAARLLGVDGAGISKRHRPMHMSGSSGSSKNFSILVPKFALYVSCTTNRDAEFRCHVLLLVEYINTPDTPFPDISQRGWTSFILLKRLACLAHAGRLSKAL